MRTEEIPSPRAAFNAEPADTSQVDQGDATIPEAEAAPGAARAAPPGNGDLPPAPPRRVLCEGAVADVIDYLVTGPRGEPRGCEANVAMVLRGSPSFEGRFRRNTLSGAVEVTSMPWRACEDWRAWTDRDDTALACRLQVFGLPVGPGVVAAAVELVADDREHNPVTAYLDGLSWDGTPRLDRLMTAYVGARGTDEEEWFYLAEVGRRFMISAAARAFRPGCKADHVPVLVGPQGAGKSSAVAALVPDESLFTDGLAELGTKDSAQDLRGKWLIEVAELAAMRRVEVERVKAFVSRAVDHYRPSYGRRSVDVPRRCAFIGTSNADTFNPDDTGGRRFWPVKVGRVDLGALRRDRDQLWAEAVAAFRAGERWWPDERMARAAAEQQESRRITDPWQEPVLEWTVGRQEVAVGGALRDAVGLSLDRHDQKAQNRVASILRTAGWERTRKRVGGVLTWVYCRPAPEGDGPGPQGDVPSVPTPENRTGNGKANDFNAVPSVPSVPTCFAKPCGDTAQGPPGASYESQGKAGNSGNSGNTVENKGFSVPTPAVMSGNRTVGSGNRTVAGADSPPPWDDLDGWRARVRAAADRQALEAVVATWAAAAGGGAVADGAGRALVLPPGLPNTFPLRELKNQADRLGWNVRESGR